MPSPILLHEDYISEPNYEAGDSESAHLSEPTIKRKTSRISIVAHGLIPVDLLTKASPTASINMDNVQDVAFSNRESSESMASRSANSSSLSASVTPHIRLHDEADGNEINTMSLDKSTDGPDSFLSNGSLSRVLSPLVNDTRSNYNMAAPSIFSEGIDSRDGSANVLDQSSLADLGFKIENTDTSSDEELFFSRRKHFFILSCAGKPIYSMHGSEDIITVYAGLIQTIISFFEYGSDGFSETLKSVVADGPQKGQQIRFLFLNKSPILLMACSTLGESDTQLNQQLDFLYNFLLATLSKPHIDKVFQRRENFDLRNVLGKTDIACLDAICNDLANFNNSGLILGGLECLRLHKTTRNKIDDILLKNKTESLLYGLLVAPGGRLVSVLRPKRHTLHTSDMQLLFSMIFNTNTFKSSVSGIDRTDDGISNGNSTENLTLSHNEDFWVPVCLPKFNPNGFLYAFIQFVELKDERLMKLHDLNLGILDEAEEQDVPTQLTIIMISASKETFFEMRKASNIIVQDLKLSRAVYRELYKSIVGTQGADGSTGLPSGRVSPIDIPAPLVKHFVFKSKRYTQYVYSRLQGNKEELKLEDNKQLKGQLMMIYAYLQSKRSSSVRIGGANIGLNDDAQEDSAIDFLRENYMDMIKWKAGTDFLTGILITTPAYEVFLINNGGIVNKKIIVDSCKRIIRWCRRNEGRLFIKSGAVF
ncbi:hypothetical protein FOA43_003663 [Brettanomyces nanus]|uniref:Vacuolar fusion protein MON1 n=1 Tax=Eeniella nana TaxID=13502 RepID=A0A875RWF5_EENNA|nr:uncharacterized protein FOA43_003663 [Brettanomyces nanus]QPG76277.1 hypothetical protein FOA43_003663 [Brettanomyces nanus]